MAFKINYICVPKIPKDEVGRVKNLMKLARDFGKNDAVKGRVYLAETLMFLVLSN